ncbi:LytR C-terminal domain-containing protein [Actinoplanes oblitus]|uniref:LytR C-terminal domain-containing protein n=1 Tax=Actinoplanes oblitus TaxID=3040509 RepID=A0ABY8WHP2_9ACTN|nr:LytR C-terminal domain-containing protein [Actinoplanes oblitus]WIM97401.1 LytR C-terminal domain-containing protein [Actinoplanes oblitus]
MSRPVPDRLRDLEADVRDLRVLPAAAIRARGRRRRRRQLAAVTTAGVVLAAGAGVALAWPRQPATTAGDLPSGDAPVVEVPADREVRCVLMLPDDPAKVRIRVLDGGAPAALIDATADQLRKRRFRVLNGATGSPLSGAASVSYGPAAIGAAVLVRAELHDAATMLFDPSLPDATVEVTLGAGFTRLATTTETNRNLVAIGEPVAPPECSIVVTPSPGG